MTRFIEYLSRNSFAHCDLAAFCGEFESKEFCLSCLSWFSLQLLEDFNGKRHGECKGSTAAGL
jgi:hypothetical protein